MSKKIHLEPEHCKFCGLCLEHCPVKALEASDLRNTAGYRTVKLSESNPCIGCGLCELVCPEPWALELRSFKASQLEAERAKKAPSKEESGDD